MSKAQERLVQDRHRSSARGTWRKTFENEVNLGPRIVDSDIVYSKCEVKMKVAVVANCQGESVAACARAMSPLVEFEFILITQLWNGERNLDDILGAYDYIFAQTMIKEHVRSELSGKVFYFPSIVFPAFHPDITFVRGKRPGGNVETVPSPMVIYHSAIALCGFLAGKSVDDVLAMYNSAMYARVGYLEAWEASKADLLAEGDSVGMPLGALLSKWIRRGVFMYSFNHPTLQVVSDVTRVLLHRSGIAVEHENVVDYIPDPLRAGPIWPVYPAVAERFGERGDYTLKLAEPNGIMTLRQFVEDCFTVYGWYERDSLEALSFSVADRSSKMGLVESAASPPSTLPGNPYKDLPRQQFWRPSVALVSPTDLDPVISSKFRITKSDKVATAGSCFAQNIARTLATCGFNYFVPEKAPAEFDEAEAARRNYGTYSARYGNIYTVRQLLQLIQRAEGRFHPRDVYWTRRDGSLVDPFRPQVEPDGFPNVDELIASRDNHLALVRALIREMDIFIFTLGLTEGWRSKIDGAVFPLAPGVSGGELDSALYEFVNFDVDDTKRDLITAIDLLREINPGCRIILTVSPVPLIATFENRHVLVSTTYSKSVLRVAAGEIAQTFQHVEYYPSYELITGSYSRGSYFEDDLRGVTDAGVAHVMRVFLRHYDAASTPTSTPQAEVVADVSKSTSMFKLVCDEEAIARF